MDDFLSEATFDELRKELETSSEAVEAAGTELLEAAVREQKARRTLQSAIEQLTLYRNSVLAGQARAGVSLHPSTDAGHTPRPAVPPRRDGPPTVGEEADSSHAEEDS